MTKRTTFGLTAVAVALIISWPVAGRRLAEALIVQSEPVTAEALMVLSGSSLQAERVAWAAELFHQGKAPLVILTDDGTEGPWSRQRQARPMMIERASDALLAAGVPVGRIVRLPGTVRSTHDEAMALRAYLHEQPLRSLLIVTSAYHSRRAHWVFRRVLGGSGTKIDVDPVPPGVQSPLPERWWLTERGWLSVAAEYAKLGYYFVRY